jgi:hypothetical protein
MAEWESSGHGMKACKATTSDFMIDIAGDLKAPWNVSAGQVFANYLIEKMGHNDTLEMWNAIVKAFTNRVKSLKLHAKRDTLPQAGKAAK